MDFSFNKVRKDYIKVLQGRRRPTFAPINRSVMKIPMRPGALLQQSETDMRVIEVPVVITAKNWNDIQKLKEDLASWLVTDEPKELTFDDEPDRVYYAMIEGGVDLHEIIKYGIGMLTFICPDPYKYGLEYSYAFNSSGVLQFTNDGSVNAFPTYEIDVSKSTTLISLVKGDNHITIGKPGDVSSVEIVERDLILYEKFDSMTGWTSGTAIQDGFTQMGSIYVNNGNFEPQSFGTTVDPNITKWRGPAYVKDLPRQVQDFYLECFMDMKSYKSTPAERAAELGRISVWLLDINNQVIGKTFVEDPTAKTMMVRGYGRLGPEANGKTIMNHSDQAYNQFDGLITIHREGKWWYFQIGMYDNATGRRHGRFNAKYYDIDGTYQTKIAKIQVGFQQYQNYSFPSMILDTMRFYELNGTGGVSPEEVPIIAQAGDRIEIETSTGQIYRNGEPWYKRLDPTSHFFPVEKGIQNIHLYPNDIGTAKAKIRKRWL